MEIIYNIGMICLLKDSGMGLVVFNNTLSDSSIEVIGCYQDHNKVIKRIKRNSKYGIKILSLLFPIPEQLSQDQTKLKEIVNMLSGKIGML